MSIDDAALRPVPSTPRPADIAPESSRGIDADPSVGVFLVLAEFGLMAMALGTTAGFARLFIGWSFLGTLAAPLIACWASAVVFRRLRVPVGWSAAASVALAAVVLTWRFAPGTSFVGLPTPSTLGAVQDELRRSFGEFSRLVAPVEATNGFLIVLAATLWVFGFFADTAAFRYRGPVQAVIPYAATFVAAGILARDTGRAGAALAFVGGLAVYATTQRALRASERRWIRGETGRGTWAVTATGGALAVVAVLAGTLVGPRLPGDTTAVVDLRDLGQGGGARTVVSPFVGVRSLLGEQSDRVVFTVQSTVPSYWRLTALEQYDSSRDIWVSRGSYRRVDGSLGVVTPAGVPTTDSRQTFRIDNLGGLWMPAAYQPARVSGDFAISFDSGSSSIIVRDSSLQTGSTYSVDSKVAALTPAALSGSVGSDALDPEFTRDPGLSEPVRTAMRQATRNAVTPYQKAMALQTYFRNGFAYDTGVDYSNDTDPVLGFIRARAGFCQQFASTFALMARSLGLPARVAVGFTPGDSVAQLPGAGGPGFVVRGRHAHAWPEVYFDGVGWVPFEPTPGRGNPQATAYTGIPPQQAAPPPSQAATTTQVPVTTQVASGPTPTTPANQVDAVSDPAAGATPGSGRGGGRPAWMWPVLLGVVGLSILVGRAGAGGRRRRRLRADPHGGRIAAAWDDTVRWLDAVGLRLRSDETPQEFACRAVTDNRLAGTDDGARSDHGTLCDALRDLAWAETVRRFGRDEPSPELCEAAEAAADVVRVGVRATATRAQQARHLVG